MKAAVVIDTNVPIVANGKASHASVECELACVESLVTARNNQRVLVDELGLIIEEYRKHLSPSGAPGVGDAFFKWLWDNQWTRANCDRIRITPTDRHSSNFAEFPSDPALALFDKSDRKFVAVAVASGENPPILNAVDADWWIHHSNLIRNGITVTFLCPELTTRII